MTRRGGVMLSAALAMGLLLLLWVASAPAPKTFSGGRVLNQPTPTPTPTTTPVGPPNPISSIKVDPNRLSSHSWMAMFLNWVLAAAAIYAIFWAGRWLWQHRPREVARRRRAVTRHSSFEVLADPATITDTLTADRSAQEVAVLSGSPRNGIVACWQRLEQIIAATGWPRERWETPTEFTIRILKRVDVDPRPVARLADLYREARFSDHNVEEHHREAARAALGQLHADLEQTAGRSGPAPVGGVPPEKQ